jgi:hypothetical protein
MTTNGASNLVYKVGFGIASFLLILLIGYFAQSVVALQKFGFENRERIIKVEQCQRNIEDNQEAMIETQKDILKSITALNNSMIEHISKTQKR